MGIQTIAERVESAEVLAELGRLGIGYAQGFHIAAPPLDQGIPVLARALEKVLGRAAYRRVLRSDERRASCRHAP